MKIAYLTHNTFPNKTAAALNIHLMSNALSLDNDVTLFSPIKFWRSYVFKSHIELYGDAYYSRSFIFDLPFFHKTYDKIAVAKIKRSAVPFDLVYCRKISTAKEALNNGLKVVLEIHSMHEVLKNTREFHEVLYRKNFIKLVLLNGALYTDVCDCLNIDSTDVISKIVIAHDAVNINDLYDIQSIKFDGINAGYIGKVSNEKGVNIILKMAMALPEVTFHLIGPVKDKKIHSLLKLNKIDNVRIYGYLPHKEALKHMKGMSFLLLPNPPIMILDKGDDIGKYTSPMKLFEYMASCKPIIASDSSAVLEVLNKKNSLIASFNDVDEWVNCARLLISDNSLCESLSKQAYSDVNNYTFSSRVERIISNT